MKGQGMLKKMKNWKDRILQHERPGYAASKRLAVGNEHGHKGHHKHHKKVHFYQLFRYTSKSDRCFVTLALIACVIVAAGFPVLNIVAGHIAALLAEVAQGERFCNDSVPYHDKSSWQVDRFYEDLARYCVYLIACGVVQMLAGYLVISLFHRVSKRVVSFRETFSHHLRVNYFEGLLRQDLGWYDTRDDKSFTTRIEEDVRIIEQAIGEKLGLFVYYALNSLFCLLIAFFYGWKLTLALLAPFPIMAVVVLFIEEAQCRLTVREQAEFGKSGAIVQQALMNIKTVFAFGGHEREVAKYEACLTKAQAFSRRRGFVTASGVSVAWLFNFLSYSMVIWYGTYLLVSDWNKQCTHEPYVYDVGTVIIIIFNVLDVEFNLSQCMLLLEILSQGCGAATPVYTIIDRIPDIDCFSEDGLIPKGKRLRGKIEFQDMGFIYPARPDFQVLQDLNLTIEPGMTVALVGNSGCGKSTCLQLLQRFYNPTEGKILVDEKDITSYNVKWYRSQIAVVGQEPVLFNTTIVENIRYGKLGVTNQEIEDACRLANCHGFIESLPKGYQTMVGDRGTQLSGGQKQRIAIARAFIQNPSILLLDEVTSALDNNNEYIIQKAIDSVRRGRTTILVTHHLRTVRNADLIVVMDHGQITKSGTAQELLHAFEMYTDGEDQEFSRISYSVIDPEMNDKYRAVSIDGRSIAPVENASCDDDGSRASVMSTVSLIVPPATPGQVDDFDPEQKGYFDKIKSLSTLSSIFSLVLMDKRVIPLLLLGILFSIAHGLVVPATAYLFDEVLQIFVLEDADAASHEAEHLIWHFLILGCASAIIIFFAILTFSLSGVRVSNLLRKRIFRAIISQDLGWFQKPYNNVGILCSQIAEDAALVHEASGNHMETLTQSIATVVFSVILSFVLHYKLAGVGLAFVPPILIASFFNSKWVENQESDEKMSQELASTTSFQAVTNIRTVASLNLQRYFLRKYQGHLDHTRRHSSRQSHVLGIVFGVSQGIMYFAYAGVLFMGGSLVQKENLNYAVVFTIGELLIWTMLEMGQTLAYLPDFTNAKVAAGRMLIILRRNPYVVDETVGHTFDSTDGKLEFQNVCFHYPSRKNYQVLKNVCWDAAPHDHIAIIGPSGSGKSTVVELILRFYDPTTGRILLDDTDVKHLNVASLRSNMSIVSQEPSLFDDTIANNIAYGDNTREVPMEDIIAAAKMANIHEFVTELSEGYETRVGDQGVQLSGGQKQRVAIARALLKDPKILLLDEATSALDRESEDIIMATLEKVEADRTCIKVAHHLSHIRDCKLILVVNCGRLVESGTHAQLIKLRGIYYQLWCIQAGIRTKT